METLDGYIENLFRTEKPLLSKKDFDKNDVWVCDLLNQDIDLANEYTKHKLSKCKDILDKLELLYSSRSCFKSTIEELRNELNPEYNSSYYFYRGSLSNEQMKERLSRYEKALSMTEQAICYYIDCKSLAKEKSSDLNHGYSNSQLVLIFYYFFKQSGLEPRISIDIAPIAKFLHLVTGKDFKAITHSDIYKKLQKAPNVKSDKAIISDLESIKPLFQKVQLNEIVKMIDNEIEMARAESKRNR